MRPSRAQSNSQPHRRHGEAEQLRDVLGAAYPVHIKIFVQHGQKSFHLEESERTPRTHARTRAERSVGRPLMRARVMLHPSLRAESERLDEILLIQGRKPREDYDRSFLRDTIVAERRIAIAINKTH